MSSSLIPVYRFRLDAWGIEASATHMWGTREAIAALKCAPIDGSERHVAEGEVDLAGFYYDPAGH